jgi:hypothetical protein
LGWACLNNAGIRNAYDDSKTWKEVTLFNRESPHDPTNMRLAGNYSWYRHMCQWKIIQVMKKQSGGCRLYSCGTWQGSVACFPTHGDETVTGKSYDCNRVQNYRSWQRRIIKKGTIYNVKGYSPFNTELHNYVLANVLKGSCMSNRYRIYSRNLRPRVFCAP